MNTGMSPGMSPGMSLYDEYEFYIKKYQGEYGDKCVVLYRCGQFYEMYSINDGLIDIKRVSDLLNIQVSRRNKAIVEINRVNTLMAGFPMFALRKFVNILVDHNYTVVIVDQVSDPPKPKRAVTEIISPGTQIDVSHTLETSNLMCIYLEEIKEWKTNKPCLCVGVSIIDLSTGVSKIFETASKNNDFNYGLDETYRLVSFYNPKEIIVCGTVKSLTYDNIISYLDISGKCVHDKINMFPIEITTVIYQEQLLSKVFPKHNMLSVFDYLDLSQHPFATTSFVYILQFAVRHNENILNQICKPCMIKDDKLLMIHYNSAKQLNIVGNDSNNLLAMLNNTVTAIGGRMFKDSLLNPIIDIKELENRYEIVGSLMTYFDIVRKHMKKIYDLERLIRKMNLNRFHPADFIQVDDTIDAVFEIMNALNSCHETKTWIGWAPNMHTDMCTMKTKYSNIIDMTQCAKYHLDNIDCSIFIKGIHEDIDCDQTKLDDLMYVLNGLVSQLNNNREGFFKLDHNERDGYHLVITNKRFNECKKNMADFECVRDGYVFKFSEFNSKPVSASSSSSKIHHKHFQKISDAVTVLQNKLRHKVIEAFQSFIKDFIGHFEGCLEKLCSVIGYLDIYSTHAYNAHTFKYYKPRVTQNINGKSYVNVRDLRHPIIERVNDKVEYVTNDLALGNMVDGLLLFGLNCSGKTSLSKAVALNVIMAQAGSFVPSHLEFSPYESIFTRIPSGDDIFKSMSTFAVEMGELRNILSRANKNSLIVGDEISHGTEVTSGVSIVSAAICELAKRGSTFIFATHLHNITEIEEVNALVNVSFKHLGVNYDEASKKLIYDRKLRDGPGSSIYGLEVCKALDLPSDFLELANSIRQKYIKVNRDIVTNTKSKYNAKVFVDVCSICGKDTDEIHHIQQQKDADANGFINGTHVHMNKQHNLVNVCAKCHDEIHAGNIKVNGYIQTSDGVQLVWERQHKLSDDHHTNMKRLVIALKKEKKTITHIAKITGLSVYKVNKIIKEVSS